MVEFMEEYRKLLIEKYGYVVQADYLELYEAYWLVFRR